MNKHIINSIAVLALGMAAACTDDPYKDDLILPT